MLTNILDKTQSSFKQVVSNGAVQGDPLFLFKKTVIKKNISRLTDKEVLYSVLAEHITEPDFDNRICFSRYINRCFELGVDVRLDAKQVYEYYDSQKRVK